MPDGIRLLIADDHAVVRRGLRLFLDLQPDIDVVGEAADGDEAVAQAATLRPDVVVLDISMPRLGGIEAAAVIRERVPDAKVLTLSTYSDESLVLAALRAGATGYLLKQTEPEQLAEAIRTVHRGEPVLCREAIRGIVAAVGRGERRPEGTVTLVLTDIEGSTTLLEELGEPQARALFAAHDGVVREALSRHGGSEIEREGDAFVLAFPSARAAVACAAEAQRRLAEEGLPRVRMGVHTGEVVAEQARLFGRAVFVAARVAGKAAGGQILATEITRTLVGDGGLRFRDCGLHDLKGFSGSHRLWEVEWASVS